MPHVDVDGLFDELLQKLQAAGGCDVDALDTLRTFLQQLDRLVSEADEDDLDTFLEDSEDELSLALNDAEWRADSIGESATHCGDLLDLVYRHLVRFNENIEVILATNPYISPALIDKLAQSQYAWEEDGTTQALARNTSNEQVLAQLSTSDDNSTRYDVASNPHTPAEVLARLAQDVDISNSRWFIGRGLDSFIQVAVVNNPATPTETLAQIASGAYSFSLIDFETKHGWQLLSEQDLVDLQTSIATAAKARLSSQS